MIENNEPALPGMEHIVPEKPEKVERRGGHTSQQYQLAKRRCLVLEQQVLQLKGILELDAATIEQKLEASRQIIEIQSGPLQHIQDKGLYRVVKKVKVKKQKKTKISDFMK